MIPAENSKYETNMKFSIDVQSKLLRITGSAPYFASAGRPEIHQKHTKLMVKSDNNKNMKYVSNNMKNMNNII